MDAWTLKNVLHYCYVETPRITGVKPRDRHGITSRCCSPRCNRGRWARRREKQTQMFDNLEISSQNAERSSTSGSVISERNGYTSAYFYKVPLRDVADLKSRGCGKLKRGNTGVPIYGYVTHDTV